MNLIYLALFGIVMLFIMALVSNSSYESISNIEDQIWLLNCPFPIVDKIATLQSIDGFNLNYTTSTFGNGTNYEGTYFQCRIVDGQFNANTQIKEYGATLFSVIPYGYFGYLLDYAGTIASKVYAVATLISFFITPANFNVLGFGLDDLSGSALAILIGIYALAYAFIFIWVISTIAGIISGATGAIT